MTRVEGGREREGEQRGGAVPRRLWGRACERERGPRNFTEGSQTVAGLERLRRRGSRAGVEVEELWVVRQPEREDEGPVEGAGFSDGDAELQVPAHGWVVKPWTLTQGHSP